ncbi:MAG: transcriptional regulator with XRE-family HTH domain [Arenicella sp.]|jgi:transcriptional regulator with XRE-family HTH domain
MSAKAPELLDLGKKVRRFREKFGFSQDKFAYEVGLGRSYYGSLERGEINPSILTLVKITRALNVELADIMPATL